MAAVFQELEISWGGEVYRVKPTMKLLNQVEQNVSLSSIAFRLGKNEPPVSLMAVVFGIFLRSAGCDVTDEEIYAELILGDKTNIVEAANLIIMAAYPQLGKPEAETTSEPVKKSAKRTKS